MQRSSAEDIAKKAEGALRLLAAERKHIVARLTLRLVTHISRAQINQLRRSGVAWAVIASALCDEFDFPNDDPKERGRVVSRYHSENLSKSAETILATQQNGSAQILSTRVDKPIQRHNNCTINTEHRGLRFSRPEIDMDCYSKEGV